jgi:hypothetical protein
MNRSQRLTTYSYLRLIILYLLQSYVLSIRTINLIQKKKKPEGGE